MSVRPGDLIRFHGLIGEDRGHCLVLAVVPDVEVPWPGKRVLMLTGQCRLITRDMGADDDDIPWTKINED